MEIIKSKTSDKNNYYLMRTLASCGKGGHYESKNKLLSMIWI